MDLESLLGLLASLSGLGALIAALVNVLKTAGVVQDGQAATVSAGLNLTALAVLLALGVLRPEFDLGAADRLAGQLAGVLSTVFAFVWQLGAARLSHRLVLRGLPWVGKSFS